jgi:integrase
MFTEKIYSYRIAPMQKGLIYRKGSAWMLQWNVKELHDGKLKWVARAKRLAIYCDEFRTVASVRHLAAEILTPANTRQARPESTQTVSDFISLVYLPHCKQNLRASTAYGYGHLFKLIKPHLGKIRLRDFGAVEGEKLLAAFTSAKPRAQTQCKNMKGFLSGAFRYAVRTGVIRFNPMREVLLPRNGTPMQDTHAYSMDEIHAMLKVLPEPSRTAVLVAALTGLRHSEIRGLRWEDFTGDELRVRRAVWASHVSETKTPASVAPVPVLPVLRTALEAHKKRSLGEFIFSGGTGKPLVLMNVTRREIIPTLSDAKIEWHGWHAFRRGLASNLNALGVDDSVIQKILRHAAVATTQRHYIKTTSKETQSAMEKLAGAFGQQNGQ